MIGVRSLLTQLIANGECVIACRSVPADQLAELAEIARHYRKTPTDTVRCVDEHTLLFVKALEQSSYWLTQHAPERAAKYSRVVAVLIDDLRADLLTAIELGRGAPSQ